jgi:hypothetical protein
MPTEQANLSSTPKNRYPVAMVRKRLKFFGLLIFLGLLVAGIAAAAVVISQDGMYAVNAVLRRGGSYWLPINPADPSLPIGVRLGLQATIPSASAGPLAWTNVQPGLDVAELPVIANGEQVDSILLTRIDPQKFRFVLRNTPSGSRDLKTWLNHLHPAVIINASYYRPNGVPDTPFLSDGTLLSDHNQPAAAGAFLATDKAATVVPLLNGDWRGAFAAAQNALATYPLLLGPAGPDTALQESHWLANRTFVGVDSTGRVILGTTTSAFFSLRRLALFLATAPLDLKIALNMDGGPVACQAVSVPHYQRFFCGTWESQDHDGKFLKLSWPINHRYGLPVVLAVF